VAAAARGGPDRAGLVMIRVRLLARGVYHVSWSGSELPAGDGLLVNAAQAVAPWPEIADMLVRHRPFEGGAGATLSVIRLGSRLWSCAGWPSVLVLPCGCTVCMIAWTTQCYCRALAGFPPSG
jgi:hypothetical protein